MLLSNGTIVVALRRGTSGCMPLYVGHVSSPAGPWKTLPAVVLPTAAGSPSKFDQDPYMFRTKRGYHILNNRQGVRGAAATDEAGREHGDCPAACKTLGGLCFSPCPDKAGSLCGVGHLYSPDLTTWYFGEYALGPGGAADAQCDIMFAGAPTRTRLTSRERPTLFTDAEGRRFLFTGASVNKTMYLHSFSLVQEIKTDDGLSPLPRRPTYGTQPLHLKSDDDQLSRPTQQRTSTGFAMHVADDGSLKLSSRDGSAVFVMSSSFSEAAAAGRGPPRLHRLGGQRSSVSVDVTRPTGTGTTWFVRLAGGAYNLHRELSINGSRVLVKDTITTSSQDWHHLADASAVGVQVNHSVQLTTGEPTAATVPGELYAFSCSNANSGRGADGKAKYSLNRGGFGNPSIHAETTTGGVAVVPLDDVFESHAVGTQAVIERYPRMPSSMPSCAVRRTPSILLADPYLALPPGSSHTMEFAIYPLNQTCSSYWCFINSLRRDIGATNLTIAGTGFLSMAPDNDLPQLGYAGWTDDRWESWDTAEMVGLLRNQSMHFVHGSTATLDRNATCCSGKPIECQPLECYGSCFVDSLPQSQLDYYRTLIGKTRAADSGALLMMYHESYIDTGTTVNQSDSRLLDANGKQVAYTSCAAGTDYPLFYPTTTNKHGQALEDYFRKALSLGFDGVYHGLAMGMLSFRRLLLYFVWIITNEI
jgi:hypothetical protein